jgi:hypothetical protein
VKKEKGNNERWSEKMGYFAQYKGRVFDHTHKMHPQKSDFDPLFSSFSKNGVFVPPPNSKEALIRQK